MYKIEREFTFSAAHRIEGHIKCGRLHGHNYRVLVELTGFDLPSDGMLLDFGILDEIVKPLVDAMDHRYLVSYSNLGHKDPYFERVSGERPGDFYMLQAETSTAEALAQTLCKQVRHALQGRGYEGKETCRVSRVCVWETDRNEATYVPSY